MTNSKFFFLYGLIFIFSIIFIDQYMKWVMIETVLRIEEQRDLLPFTEWFMTPKHLEYFYDEREPFLTKELLPILNLNMVWNQGVSFGFLDTNEPIMAYVFTGISVAISMGFLVWLAMAERFLTVVSTSMIVGGAIGNAIDRIRFRAVADFIEFHIGDFHFPVFNFADICITIGAIGIAWAVLFEQKKSYLTVDV
ncbi:MAG: signal peptidase II [Pseudomonadota bacterium]|nr:MAG: signal peptidase II [Pseudomonadota bacterium]